MIVKIKNKDIREVKEIQNLFADTRYCREVWRGVGNLLLQNPASRAPEIYDKNGCLSGDAILANYSYERLSHDIKELYKEDREPTELEMIIMCQLVKARYDTSAAVFIRDTLGAKPVDESKVEQVPNQFDSLSDDELEMLAAFRQEKLEAQRAAEISPTCAADILHVPDANAATPSLQKGAMAPNDGWEEQTIDKITPTTPHEENTAQ